MIEKEEIYKNLKSEFFDSPQTEFVSKSSSSSNWKVFSDAEKIEKIELDLKEYQSNCQIF